MNNSNRKVMSTQTDVFYNNPLYKLLSQPSIYSLEILDQLNALLHQQPELAECHQRKEGSFFHIICRKSHYQENISFRMIYALSNAGADPNVPDGQGNTPLHEALVRGLPHCGFDLIQALFRVGVDQRTINYYGKRADAYLKTNPQINALYKSYKTGIWDAIESSNIAETERLMKDFIQPNCKHNSNKTLLDKARDIACTSLLEILAEYQVTIEFLHSILAFDWERASIIFEHEKQFLQINPIDHLSFNHPYSKSILEYCLETHSSKSLQIFSDSLGKTINVNFLCTDGEPFFFHCFDSMITEELRRKIFSHSDMFLKSSQGETILFHLLRLYGIEPKPEYLTIFTKILFEYPLLLVQRNHNEQTIIELMEFVPSMAIYQQYRPFYQAIHEILIVQLKRTSIIKRFIYNTFGYDLLIFYRRKKLPMTRRVHEFLLAIKGNRDLTVLIGDLMQAVRENDFIKLKEIFKSDSNIFLGKDSFGRTSAHLAVLYQRYDILKWISTEHPNAINIKDNLSRTSFHYAYLMNDQMSVEILEKANARQMMDCSNCTPKDYLINRQLCPRDDFAKYEIERPMNFRSNYLKLAFYSQLKTAIEKNSIEELKSLNGEIAQMGFHLHDFNPNSSFNDYIEGQRYIPLLFLAIEHQSYTAFHFLHQSGVPSIGIFELSKSELDEHSYWKSYFSPTDQLQSLNMVEIVKNLEEDIQWKTSLEQYLSIHQTTVINIEEVKEKNTSKKDRFLRMISSIPKPKFGMCILL